MIDGLPADIVALALPLDLDKIAAVGLMDAAWRQRYPAASVVCETTVAFVVRQVRGAAVAAARRKGEEGGKEL